jgi:hypothetical protein
LTSTPTFALVDRRHLVAMEELDRVLDRDDVAVHLAVRRVDHRGQRRRLARAGRARDQHETARQAGERLDRLGHAEVLERRDRDRDHADGERDGAALLEDVAAEAAEARQAEGEVDLAVDVELLALLGRQQRVADELEVLRDGGGLPSA